MYENFLIKTPLFAGISIEEIAALGPCLKLTENTYDKGEYIYRAGDKVSDIGIVLVGSVSIEHNDVWGNTSIMDSIGPGQVFADPYACVPSVPIMVDVVATSRSKILFLDAAHILNFCAKGCSHHIKLIHNMLSIASQKNLNLSRRIFHTASKSVRSRLMSYFSFQATLQGSLKFSIPFDRQQLADYLSVNRSVLSNEISKMQKDGLIRVSKKTFEILDANMIS